MGYLNQCYFIFTRGRKYGITGNHYRTNFDTSVIFWV